jgi:hypothetical protein
MAKLNLGSGASGPAALNVITQDHTGWKHIDICPLYETTECFMLCKIIGNGWASISYDIV